jgi:hypothetical protein
MRIVLSTIVGLFLFLSGGVAAERPGELSKKELKVLLEKSSTPKDHLRLAAHYEAKALKYEAEAAEHTDLAKMYRAHPTPSEVKRPMAPDTAAHCDYVVDYLTKAAKEARSLSESHKQMAGK